VEIVILLVPLGFVLLLLALAAFVWAIRKGQFDDLDSPAWRVVFDDQDRQRQAPENEANDDRGKP
jgi:cbb3-type cytochrome oxidase maturation protein